MAAFKYIDAKSPGEAKSILTAYKGKAKIIAGGTDLVGQIKDSIHSECPEVLVNIKNIQGLDYIREDKGTLRIGALTKIEDIARDQRIRERFTALAEAAHYVASPHIREMGTIGGNICQSIRCWYYWLPSNRFNCIRKGGKICNALLGDSRYHSIFGACRISSTPCKSACPGNVEIPDYLGKIREGKLAEAAELLMGRNPLPAITGRVCPHPCETECNRSTSDESVSINAIERYLGDYILDNSAAFYKPPEVDSSKQVAVIGSGPAGLTAAYFLRKAGHAVTIFDNNKEPGGMLRYGIPAYRLPKEIIQKQVDAVKSMGISLKLNMEIGKGVSLHKLQNDYDGVVLATGDWNQPKLNIEGFELSEFGLDFLNKINSGGMEKPGKRVLVIGGGNVAVDVAISAVRLGAEDATMVCLESRDEMPAIPSEVKQAEEEGVRVMTCWGPSRITGKKDGTFSLELIKCTSVFDENNNFSPRYDNCVTETLEAERIIMAIGQKPNIQYIDIPINQERGLVKVKEETGATSVDRVFAAGDMTGGQPTVIRSIATGRRAALAILDYLSGSSKSNTDGEEIRHGDPLIFRSDYFNKTKRVIVSGRPIGERNIATEDINTISESDTAQEANRCFNCGCVAVNNSDLAPALIALAAKIKTTKRTIAAGDFFAAGKDKTVILDDDEIVTEIKLPSLPAGTTTKFIKFALRKSIDYPVVNCAAAIQNKRGVVKAAKICLNAVFNEPFRATAAEASIIGKPIDEKVAEVAGEEAVKTVCALPANKYKVRIARALVSRAVMACKSK